MPAFRPAARRAAAAALAAAVGLGVVVGVAVAQKGGKKKAAPDKPKAVDVSAASKALNGGDQDAAVAAAPELGGSRDKDAHDVLLDALATGLSPDVAIAALSAVSMHPEEGDAATLAFYARYRDPEVRAAAAQALGQ